MTTKTKDTWRENGLVRYRYWSRHLDHGLDEGIDIEYYTRGLGWVASLGIASGFWTARERDGVASLVREIDF